METTGIAEAIMENLESGLLASNFDLKETRMAGYIVCGNAEVLSKLPAVNINYASHVISEACDSPSLVSGVYERPIKDNVIRVYTLFSGLGLPHARIESLKEEAGARMDVLRNKEKNRASQMAVDYGSGTETQTKVQEIHRMVAQKKSGFGKLTGNASKRIAQKVIDRRKR